MSIVLDGTAGITTPDVESSGPVSGTTANFSGDVTLGSSVLATPSGSAPSYTCRAWVNFNGTGTVAIRASGNVSSITDNGTGDYTVNFATAMPDVNYAVSGISGRVDDGSGNRINILTVASTTTTALRVFCAIGDSAAFSDTTYNAISVFR